MAPIRLSCAFRMSSTPYVRPPRHDAWQNEQRNAECDPCNDDKGITVVRWTKKNLAELVRPGDSWYQVDCSLIIVRGQFMSVSLDHCCGQRIVRVNRRRSVTCVEHDGNGCVVRKTVRRRYN